MFKFFKRRRLKSALTQLMIEHQKETERYNQQVAQADERCHQLIVRINELRGMLDLHMASDGPVVVLDSVRWNLCQAMTELENVQSQMTYDLADERKRVYAVVERFKDLKDQLKELA